MIKSILTVCVGNICRSPMAEALLRENLPGLTVSSAGIGALIGYPADRLACELMTERNLDLSSHRARQINRLMCQQSDIILVMERAHRAFIHECYPFAHGKVFLLADMQQVDIPDPYRQERKQFEYALDLIDAGTKNWSNKIKQL